MSKATCCIHCKESFGFFSSGNQVGENSELVFCDKCYNQIRLQYNIMKNTVKSYSDKKVFYDFVLAIKKANYKKGTKEKLLIESFVMFRKLCGGTVPYHIEQEITKETGICINKNNISISENLSLDSCQTNEFRFRCRVCGNVFCYTQADLDASNAAKTESAVMGVLSGIGHLTAASVGGPGLSYKSYETGKIGNTARSRIVDYSKCPHCNSSDIEDITNSSATTYIAAPQRNEQENIDYISLLEKLAKLRAQGIITDEEFQQKKSEILAKM